MAREQTGSCPACQLWRLPLMEPAPAAQMPRGHQTLQQKHDVRDALAVMSDLLVLFSIIQVQRLGKYGTQNWQQSALHCPLIVQTIQSECLEPGNCQMAISSQSFVKHGHWRKVLQLLIQTVRGAHIS